MENHRAETFEDEGNSSGDPVGAPRRIIKKQLDADF